MEYIIKKNQLELSHRKKEGLLKLAKVIQWGRRYPVDFLERFSGMTLLDNQVYVFMNSWSTPNCVWCQCRNSGKALALDTPIQTVNGEKPMKDIRVGDYVFGKNGKATKVTYVSEIFLNHDCYEVEFEDGEKIIADAEHLWSVKVKWQDEYKVFTTYEMLNKFNQPYTRHGKLVDNYVYRVPVTDAVDYEEKNLPIDPYVLGVWLGDGNTRDTRVTCSDDDVIEMVVHLKKSKHPINIYERKDNTTIIGLGTTPRGQENVVKTKLKEFNLIQNKHIPEIYLMASVEQRMELLRGLMDTDGTVDKEGHCEFYQKKYEFVVQVSRLISSLGIKNRIREKWVLYKGERRLNHVVSFTIGKDRSCFKLERKHNRLKDTLDKRGKYKTIINIKKVNTVPTKCISVDNEDSLYLCGKNFTVTHNTTLAAPFIFSKAILIPNFNAYILSGTGDQAKEMFTKIEQITKREIASFTGLTDVFFNETVKNVANKDGFTHSPASYKFSLYNGSKVQTLNSKPDNVRSRRSNLNVYDEAGFIDEALFEASEPFLTQDSNFKLGGDIDITLEAKSFANQVIYASSASSTDTYFWRKYKEFSKKMFLNDKRYFVADINDEIVLNATHRGKIYPVALLTQETIDRKIRENHEAGMREYKNIFSRDGGDEQAIKRASIIKNSEVRPPMLFNDAKRKFVLAYDPARTYDNSVVMVAELIRDPNVGYKLKICNGVSFVDISKKKKTPMQTPVQTKLLKEMILDYNGKMAADYENIDALLIDTGSGGGGMAICDYFMEDWVDEKGNKHKGLIDKEFSADYISKFPNAANKIKAIVPQKHRTDMFDAMVEMVGLDLISFPAEYDMKGYITMYDDIIDEKGKIEQKRKMYKLSQEEELALKNIDLAKEEMVSIHKTINSSGRINYNLPPEKKNKMHDDRVFCIAMLCWHLHQLRRDDVVGKKAPEINWMDYVFVK